jgi:alpha-tubulin suppressor-like RCC1 family protein
MGPPCSPAPSLARRARQGARRLAALVAAGAALVAAPRPLRADSSAEAEELFQEGRRLLNEGRRDEGCAKFAESHQVAPSPGALLNLGDCHEHEGKLATAWADYLAAARLYRDPGNQAERDFCLRLAAQLEPRLSRLTVRLAGAVPGLVVKRDGQAVDAAQLDVALPVDPGVYVITAEARGRVPFSASVLVKEQAGATTVVVPALAPSSTLPPTPTPTLTPTPTPTLTPAPKAEAGRPALEYVIGGFGVAALGVGSTFGVMALLNNHKAEGKCPDGQCPDGSSPEVAREATELYDRASTQAWVANVSVGLGLVAGGYLLFFAPSRPKVGSTSREHPRVAISPGPGGLTLRGRFLSEREGMGPMASASKSRPRRAPVPAHRVWAAALGGLSALAGCQIIGDFDEPHSDPAQSALRLAARASYACAWIEGGQAQCWGKHPASAGGLEANAYVPAYIQEQEGTPLAGIAALALGDEHGCARLDDGHVKCWGSNAFGQLGAPPGGDGGRSLVPVFVRDQTSDDGWLTGVAKVALGRHHSCALLNDGHGRVVCWGSNARGQLGSVLPEGNATHVPTFVAERIHGGDLTDVVEIALGNEHSCARLDDGRVKCWGSNVRGQLGRPVEGDEDASAEFVPGLEGVKEISLGGDQSCARLDDGHVTCWGNGYNFSPTPVADQHGDANGLLSDTVELDSGGSSYNCVRSRKEDVKCWWRDPKSVNGSPGDQGALALRSTLRSTLRPSLRGRESPEERDPEPEPVKDANGNPLAGVAEIALGDEHGCARRGADSILCWGSNALGQLGNPTSAGEPEPIAYPLPVEGLTLVRRP